MQVDKVVGKSILTTLAAIAALVAAAVLILVLLFPSTLMSVTYDLGMDGASVFFAKKAYDQSGEIGYVAFAVETSIGSDDDASIVECTELMFADSEFISYTTQKDVELNAKPDSYRKFLYTNYALAKYDLGNRQAAVNFVKTIGGTAYSSDEPIVALFVYSLSKQDGESVRGLYSTVESLTVSAEDSVRFQNLLALAAPYLG